jgi:hypothetical protein
VPDTTSWLLIPRPGRTVCKAPEPRVEIYILFEPGRPHRNAPVPPIISPEALKLEIDETLSDDIWLFPYASICPVLMALVVKEETANWGVLIVVAVIVDALTFVKLWTANGVRVVILPPEVPKASPKKRVP